MREESYVCEILPSLALFLLTLSSPLSSPPSLPPSFIALGAVRWRWKGSALSTCCRREAGMRVGRAPSGTGGREGGRERGREGGTVMSVKRGYRQPASKRSKTQSREGGRGEENGGRERGRRGRRGRK